MTEEVPEPALSATPVLFFTGCLAAYFGYLRHVFGNADLLLLFETFRPDLVNSIPSPCNFPQSGNSKQAAPPSQERSA